MKKIWLNFQKWLATMPTTALTLGAIVGVSLPPYSSSLTEEICRAVIVVVAIVGSWLLARRLARKSLTKKGISYDC